MHCLRLREAGPAGRFTASANRNRRRAGAMRSTATKTPVHGAGAMPTRQLRLVVGNQALGMGHLFGLVGENTSLTTSTWLGWNTTLPANPIARAVRVVLAGGLGVLDVAEEGGVDGLLCPRRRQPRRRRSVDSAAWRRSPPRPGRRV